MPTYKDEHAYAKHLKLSYYNAGFAPQCILELVSEIPSNFSYQYRSALERALAYLGLKSDVKFHLMANQAFPFEAVLYLLYNGILNLENLIVSETVTAARKSQLQNDLIGQVSVVTYDTFDTKFREIALSEVPVFFLIDLKEAFDIRTVLDYVSTQRQSMGVLVNYGACHPVNERLYALKNKIRLLEHLDGSADLIPI